MISNEILILTASAASIGLLHTLMGPDHYLPFILMSKARNWSRVKTLRITFLCGLGHVASSVVLGALGIVFGISINKLEIFESVRGSVASWMLLLFGFIYFIYGLAKAVKNKPHQHWHMHTGSDAHRHAHDHQHNHPAEHELQKLEKPEHGHGHENETASNKSITPWVLFTIFLFGPCEPLIPLLMYPAARNSVSGVILVTAVFSLLTVATMMTVVWLSLTGIQFIPMSSIERYMHALAGALIFLSGVGMVFLGL